jgi:hypothetical protein
MILFSHFLLLHSQVTAEQVFISVTNQERILMAKKSGNSRKKYLNFNFIDSRETGSLPTIPGILFKKCVVPFDLNGNLNFQRSFFGKIWPLFGRSQLCKIRMNGCFFK